MNPSIKPESELQTPAPEAVDPTQAATQSEIAQKPGRKRPSDLTLKLLSFLVGLLVLIAGLAFLYFEDTPVFAIPLVVTLPVIAAVAFRNCWD